MPETTPPKDSAALAATILREHYNLPDATLTPIAQGVVNRNYRVETPDGPLVLKHYLPGRYSEDEARRSCRVQTYLHGAGLPVPAIRPNQAGDLLTVAPDGFYTVSAFVPGRHHARYHLPPRAAHAMGRALGQLDLALATWAPGQPFRVTDRGPALAALRELLTLAQAQRHRSEVDATACLILERWRGLAGALAGGHARGRSGVFPGLTRFPVALRSL
jgi:Ser/Thr protein kinase RdoA (MazF antagonist)